MRALLLPLQSRFAGRRVLFRRSLAAFTAAAAFALAGAVAARAQDAQPAPGQTTLVKPDLQVMVMPTGPGQWMVSEVYPGKVDQGVALQRFNGLLTASGWSSVGSPVFKNANLGMGRADKLPLDRSADGRDAEAPQDPVMSSVTGMVSGALLNPAAGSFVLEPFVLSLRDLAHVNMIFMMSGSASFAYHGLLHYDSPAVTVDLVGATKGTYVYTVNIKDHGMTALRLPQTQSAGDIAAAAPDSPGKTRVFATGLIVALALGAGVLVFIWAVRLSGGGASGKRV